MQAGTWQRFYVLDTEWDACSIAATIEKDNPLLKPVCDTGNTGASGHVAANSRAGCRKQLTLDRNHNGEGHFPTGACVPHRNNWYKWACGSEIM